MIQIHWQWGCNWRHPYRWIVVNDRCPVCIDFGLIWCFWINAWNLLVTLGLSAYMYQSSQVWLVMKPDFQRGSSSFRCQLLLSFMMIYKSPSVYTVSFCPCISSDLKRWTIFSKICKISHQTLAEFWSRVILNASKICQIILRYSGGFTGAQQALPLKFDRLWFFF